MRRDLQGGAALLTAMLTVTLVATFAAAALWQQWRSVEIEAAERSRTQMQWVLNGALDWARLILQEDARSGAEVDHLSEPWALPLQEARLSSFLALDREHTDDAMEAFLSGQITDQQALLNVRNLVQDGKPVLSAVQAFERLFAILKLPTSQLQVLVDGLISTDAAAKVPASDAKPSAQADAALQPHRLAELVWLGLPAPTVRALTPFAVLLPVATPLNLNTASAEVLRAALPSFDLGRAQQFVAQRASAHYASVADAFRAAGIAQASGTPPSGQANPNAPLAADSKDFSVVTRYFAVRGRLRLGPSTVQEVSLIERNGQSTRVVWRQREVLLEATTASLQ